MNCTYCDQIQSVDPSYGALPAAFDLGSMAPRCARHWRYRCGQCRKPSHFMASAYCTHERQFFCAGCASEREEVAESFWAWEYFYRYRSPWTGAWAVALDRLEFEGLHPLQRFEQSVAHHSAISSEPHLVRYRIRRNPWRLNEDPSDDKLRQSWNANAASWDARYDADGDPNRRFQSDEPLLALLGEVNGLSVLDLGSGNGYLSRKLASNGAKVVGVELSDEFYGISQKRERDEPKGIVYHHASVASMPFLSDGSFDKIVSNYVLMDVREWTSAVIEAYRVLKPGGVFVAAISHPCFSTGYSRWITPAEDSPRPEDRLGLLTDGYFHRGAYAGVWGGLKEVISFHRPIRDYWETFSGAGFSIEGFEEPSLTERGRREMPLSRVRHSMRVPYSCIFKLVRAESNRA